MQGSQRCFGVILAFTQRFRVAVPGPADTLLQSGWGAGAAAALWWRWNSPARQQCYLVQQHKGNPCRHGHCCCPAELRHQGTGLAPSQQNAFPPTVAGGHFCGISFPVCLSRVTNPHQGSRRGGMCLCIECKAFLVDTQQGLPSLDPALVYRAHCPKCIPSDSSPTFYAL